MTVYQKIKSNISKISAQYDSDLQVFPLNDFLVKSRPTRLHFEADRGTKCLAINVCLDVVCCQEQLFFICLFDPLYGFIWTTSSTERQHLSSAVSMTIYLNCGIYLCATQLKTVFTWSSRSNDWTKYFHSFSHKHSEASCHSSNHFHSDWKLFHSCWDLWLSSVQLAKQVLQHQDHKVFQI